MVPPLLPAHDQFHGPLPVTAEAAPIVQSPVLGAVLTALPLAVPQEPFTAEEATGAEQLAVVPPLLPAHDQFHGPLPVTAEAAPIVQSPVLGAVLTALPLAVPQEPFTAEEATGAEQLTIVPLVPKHTQVHGPVPRIFKGVPALHKLVVGLLLAALPLAVPHEAFAAATEAEQLAVVPPLLPAQDQFHGPLPVTAEAVPIVQSPVLGAVLTALPLAVPQEPFTAEEATGAEQLAVVPPLLPAQDQFHGPLPVTAAPRRSPPKPRRSCKAPCSAPCLPPCHWPCRKSHSPPRKQPGPNTLRSFPKCRCTPKSTVQCRAYSKAFRHYINWWSAYCSSAHRSLSHILR